MLKIYNNTHPKIAKKDNMQTRSGRRIRAPVNEYTSRQYIPGSRFVGADHYDRQYSVNSSIPTADQEEEEENEYDFYDNFLENDYETDEDDSDYVPSEPSEDEEYDSESEDEDDSEYVPSEQTEDEEYDTESEDERVENQHHNKTRFRSRINARDFSEVRMMKVIVKKMGTIHHRRSQDNQMFEARLPSSVLSLHHPSLA